MDVFDRLEARALILARKIQKQKADFDAERHHESEQVVSADGHMTGVISTSADVYRRMMYLREQAEASTNSIHSYISPADIVRHVTVDHATMPKPGQPHPIEVHSPPQLSSCVNVLALYPHIHT